ncbi:hypothetical protein [Myroides sp. WP-1]|uniref:hypothetical protein n=1 Tax=Myroides sp. WP-1 TaxID=2759944 RepID=UPI0015F925C4|nr:hypothetical protein [Myroides sp. WP-1]MBB1140233.1 hypothetical protein [Myroides sp. WP-1]
MKSKILILTLFLSLLYPFLSAAQSTNTADESYFFNHLSISAGLSTLGFTAELTTPISHKLFLRAGINTFHYNTKTHAVQLNDPYGLLHHTFGQDVSYLMRGQAKNTHGHVVLDFYPLQKGLLYFSTGLYFGRTILSAHGIIANSDGTPAQSRWPSDWPTLAFNNQKLDIINGRLDGELILGNFVKPYFGFGLGRAIPKKRLGVKIEMGLLFSGDYVIKQNGHRLDQTLKKEHNFEAADSYLNWFRFYPIAKAQLTYRLF